MDNGYNVHLVWNINEIARGIQSSLLNGQELNYFIIDVIFITIINSFLRKFYKKEFTKDILKSLLDMFD